MIYRNWNLVDLITSHIMMLYTTAPLHANIRSSHFILMCLRESEKKSDVRKLKLHHFETCLYRRLPICEFCFCFFCWFFKKDVVLVKMLIESWSGPVMIFYHVYNSDVKLELYFLKEYWTLLFLPRWFYSCSYIIEKSKLTSLTKFKIF